ncbi:MAG: hypothetical protein E6Q67_15130 [Roseateles sp.]|nr:MAG: hypothetical protein E6Q67_15130 [Roseateles sp.]
MTPLAQLIIDAHGGLSRWQTFNTLSVDLQQGGVLWPLKGQAGVLDRTTVTVGLKAEWASHAPFGEPGRYSRFTPQLVELLTGSDDSEAILVNPRDSFAGHTLETSWTQTQLAYFAGCAMWTYLNLPFLLAWDGVQTEELSPWQEKGQTWRRLRVSFPASIATHSTVQTLYVDEAGLLRRHDYDVEIGGNTPAAHYMDHYTEVQGIKFPTRRRIYPRGPEGQAMTEPLVVSIDLSNFVLA